MKIFKRGKYCDKNSNNPLENKGDIDIYETWYRCKPTVFHFLNKSS